MSQDLPALATDALVEGWESQSLRVLAGEPSNAYFLDLGDLFEKAMSEVGRPRLTEVDAFRRYVAYLAWLMVSGRVGLLDGVQRIERIPCYDVPELDGLGHLASVADEWDAGWGRTRAELEADSRRLASELLAQLDADDPLPQPPPSLKVRRVAAAYVLDAKAGSAAAVRGGGVDGIALGLLVERLGR